MNITLDSYLFQVRVSDKFMSAKSEFSYMSGMSTDRDPNSMASERKPGCSQPTSGSSPSSTPSAPEDSSSPSDPCDSDYDPGGYHEDTRPSSPNVFQNDRQNGHRSTGAGRSGHQKDCTSDSETQGRRKKPKIESHSNSDCDSASDEDGHVNGLLNCNGGFASPFPSPDHNYAISPVKVDPSEMKAETEEDVKEEVKQEPKEDETPNSRYKVLSCGLFNSFHN